MEEVELSTMPDGLDGADEPLIARDETASEDAHTTEDDSYAVPGRFVWLLTVAAALSGLLFGYE